MDYGLGITNWNEWMKKNHIKLVSHEKAMEYQKKKKAQEPLKDYINHIKK